MARRGVRGLPELRARLRKLPDKVQKEILAEFEKIGEELQEAMRARAPSKTGKLREGITYKVFPKTLRLQVGLRNTKAGRSTLFYGRIQDLGRKSQTVIVHRLTGAQRAEWRNRVVQGRARISRKPAGLGVTYALRVRAMVGKKFVSGRYPELRQKVRTNLQGIYARAMGDGAANG